MQHHPERAAVTGLALFTLLGGGQALFGPSLPTFQALYGLSVPSAGLILTCYWAGGLSAVLVALVPRFAPFMRWRTGFAAAVLALGCFAISDSGVWPGVLLGAFGMGAGHGLLTVGLNGFFASAFGQRAPVLLNLLNAMFGVGAVIAPIVLVSFDGHVEHVFRGLAIGFALLLPLALLLDDRAVNVEADSEMNNSLSSLVRTAVRHRLFLMLMGVAVGLEVAIVGWGVTVLSGPVMPLDEARTFTSFFYVSFTCARLMAVGLSFHVRPALFVLGGFSASAILLVIVNDGGGMAGYAFASLGFAVGPLFPNLFAWAAPHIVKEPPLSALVICAGMLGGIAGPGLLSSLAFAAGAQSAFCLLSVFALVASAMVVRLIIRPDGVH